MKYVYYDDNRVLGFYDPEIHTNIPGPNFVITDEVWMAYLSDQGSYQVIAGQLVYTPVIPDPPTPEEVQAAALAALDEEYAPQRKMLWDYLNLTVNYWQDAEYATAIRAELDALEEEYNEKAGVIFNGG